MSGDSGQMTGLHMHRNRNARLTYIMESLRDYNAELLNRTISNREDAKYFNLATGGYYIMEEGHNYVQQEIEAARILADKGFKVRLQPEDIQHGGESLKGNTFPDGKLHTLWYDQYTSEEGSLSSLKSAFKHGHKKGADVVFIYDRKGKMTQENYDKAQEWYNTQRFNSPRTIFKWVIVVNGANNIVDIRTYKRADE